MKDNIVVIDDDELTLDLIKRRLRNTSVRLQCFNDGQQAIDYLRDHDSDVLLIDHCMPKRTGLEVLRELAGVIDLTSTRTFLCSAATLPGAIATEAQTLGASTMTKDLYRDRAALLQLLHAE